MGEMFDVAELARGCAENRLDEFFFTCPPLNLPGGTGSPINPIAQSSATLRYRRGTVDLAANYFARSG